MISFLYYFVGAATSNGTDQANGFDSDDDCESVTSFASSVDTLLDDTLDGNFYMSRRNKPTHSIYIVVSVDKSIFFVVRKPINHNLLMTCHPLFQILYHIFRPLKLIK